LRYNCTGEKKQLLINARKKKRKEKSKGREYAKPNLSKIKTDRKEECCVVLMTRDQNNSKKTKPKPKPNNNTAVKSMEETAMSFQNHPTCASWQLASLQTVLGQQPQQPGGRLGSQSSLALPKPVKKTSIDCPQILCEF
jgi:hypothetical protein